MSKFIEIPANKKSIANRKLVSGIGVNDADYMTNQIADGKQIRCPYYSRWFDMLTRCYSEKYHTKFPTYIGCTVCEEWLIFSNFKAWMKKRDWDGLQLDKDVLDPNNKIYSPETCVFISSALNKLLTDHAAKRGKYPQGVYYNKRNRKYKAQINVNGKSKYLGYHLTPELAYEAYKSAKIVDIMRHANEQTDERIANGLRLHAALL